MSSPEPAPEALEPPQAGEVPQGPQVPQGAERPLGAGVPWVAEGPLGDEGPLVGRGPARRRRWPGVVAACVIALACAAVAAFAGSRAMKELTRGPSVLEVQQAVDSEIGSRWRTWPSGRIFPQTLAYDAEQGGKEKAQRVGISPEMDCGKGLTKRVTGCRAVLRATYLDATQSLVVTVGVIAFADENTARTAKRAAPELRELAFPGTITARFSGSAGQESTMEQAGPYLVLTVSGQIDGRPAGAVHNQRRTLFAFAPELSDHVGEALTDPVEPACGTDGWTC